MRACLLLLLLALNPSCGVKGPPRPPLDTFPPPAAAPVEPPPDAGCCAELK